MKLFLLLTMVSGLVFFQAVGASAQETTIGDPGQPKVTYQQAPPVVPNPRKAAYEQKQQEKARKAQQDADAARQRLQQGSGVSQTAPDPVIRRYDPSVRDAISGKVISRGNAENTGDINIQRYDKARDAITGKPADEEKTTKKRQTQSDVLREKYKERREEKRLNGKLKK